MSICTDQAILRQVSRDTTIEEIERTGLAEKMFDALNGAWVQGVGIAAIQVGVPLRFAFHFVHYDESQPDKYRIDRENPVFLLNPKIIKGINFAKFPGEACLSVPHQKKDTMRYTDIVYTTFEDGKEIVKTAIGFEAVVIQHEIGHMDGKLFLDHAKKEPGRNEPCLCGSGIKYKKCCELTKGKHLIKIQPQKADGPSAADLKKAVIKP